MYMCIHRRILGYIYIYGVATVSRIDEIIGLFAKETYKRDAILQKRPTISSILLTVATPYMYICTCIYIYLDTCMNVYIHIYIFPSIFIHIYIYTCIQIYVHVHSPQNTRRRRIIPTVQQRFEKMPYTYIHIHTRHIYKIGVYMYTHA